MDFCLIIVCCFLAWIWFDGMVTLVVLIHTDQEIGQSLLMCCNRLLCVVTDVTCAS